MSLAGCMHLEVAAAYCRAFDIQQLLSGGRRREGGWQVRRHGSRHWQGASALVEGGGPLVSAQDCGCACAEALCQGHMETGVPVTAQLPEYGAVIGLREHAHAACCVCGHRREGCSKHIQLERLQWHWLRPTCSATASDLCVCLFIAFPQRPVQQLQCLVMCRTPTDKSFADSMAQDNC